MKFTMRKPCDGCPFVRANRFPLTPERVREFEENVSGGFPCHQTIDYDGWDSTEDEEGHYRDKKKEVHCAGSLILQWKAYGGFDGAVSMALSYGLAPKDWKPETHLDLDADVFDDFDEMAEAMEGF